MPASPRPTLDELSDRLAMFNRERNWEQFHTPKAVLLSMMSELGELAEHYRFLTPAQEAEYHRDAATRAKVEEELGDAFINLLLFSQKVGIDLLEAGEKTLEKNARNYPVDAAKGSPKKLKNGEAA